MGLFDWIRMKGAQTQRFVSATMRTSERNGRYSAYNSDHAQLVSQCFGFAQICASRVAKDVAAVPLRLYKPESERSDVGERRAVSMATKRYLASGAAGRKAATFRSDNDLEEVTQHPVLDFLNRPNAYQSGIEFRTLNTLFRQLAGSSFVVADGDDLALHLLFPQYVRPFASSDEIVGGFLYGRSEKASITFDVSEVLWSKACPSPFSPLEGLSPLRAVMSEQQIYAAINQTELAVFANTGRPDYLVSVEGNAGPDELDALAEKMEGYHRGPANAGRGAFIGNSKAVVTPLGWSPKDLGNVELQRHVVSTILAAFGVPESEIYMNDANRASSVSGNRQYLRQTVFPMAVQDGEDFTRFIVEDMFGLKGWCLAPDNVVGQDYATETITLSTQLAAGIATVNEARIQLGYEKVDDPEADRLRISGVPIEQSGQQPTFGGFGAPTTGDGDGASKNAEPSRVEPACPCASGDCCGQVDDRSGAGSTSDVPVADAPKPCDGSPACGCDKGLGSAKLTSQRAMFEAAAKAWVKEAPTEASPYREDEDATTRLYRKVLRGMHGRRDEILAASDDAPFGLDTRRVNVKATSDDMLRRIMDAWKIAGQAQAFADAVSWQTDSEVRSLFDVGVKLGLDQAAEITELATLDNSRAEQYFTDFQSAYVESLASVDETLAMRVEASLRIGLENGEGLRAIQGRIRAAFDEEGDSGETISESTAAMVARTETAEATIQGRLGGYASAGIKRYTFHLAPNPCEFCEAVAKEWADKSQEIGKPLVDLGSTITGADGGSMAVDFKPLYGTVHPNCRCDIVPVVE